MSASRVFSLARTGVWCLFAVLSAARAGAGTLQIDLDHDGIRDTVSISHAPAKPGLELWLSSTQRVMRLRARSHVDTLVAADVDADGWPDLVAGSTRPGGRGLHVWRNAGHGFFEKLKRRRHGRNGRLDANPDGRVSDLPDSPPSTLTSGTAQSSGSPAELSYCPLYLTLTGCTILVQTIAGPTSHAPPRSPRAPPALAFV